MYVCAFIFKQETNTLEIFVHLINFLNILVNN